MNIEGVSADGLCTQCGTCVAVCPREAISAEWNVRLGYRMRVIESRCDDCGICAKVCPGPGFDYSHSAWWREAAEERGTEDFVGPWRRLYTGWATDDETRYRGASGGLATAILQGALASGLIDAAILCRTDPENPLRAEATIARSADEIAACRGSKYNLVAMNTELRRVIREPGRYALVGLPCHIQGFRLARERSTPLRERVVFTIGIFCASSFTPRATAMEALRAGLDPRHLARVSYRGPGWPGPLHLETDSSRIYEAALSSYFPRFVRSGSPLRCRLCPDGSAELSDMSVGDAWLARHEGTPGVSDLIVRTARGEQVIDTVAPKWLILFESSPDEILRTQDETRHMKRSRYRGRLWLRKLARRPRPENCGIESRPTLADLAAGLKDFAGELRGRMEGRRYPVDG